MSEPEPQEIEELARWLVDVCQYPLDWHTAQPPPPWVRRAVEDRWVEIDLPKSDPDTTASDIRMTVAEEGGWGSDQ